MKLIQKSQTSLIVSLIIWSLAVGVGVILSMNFENASGMNGLSPASWPTASQITRNPKLPTLIMMIHPQCPCSRASVSELALLLIQEPGQMNTEVVFVKPTGVSEEWEQTDLWRSAVMIPGAHVSVDDGTEARRFGSLTSGQVMLYSKDGNLLFSGGLTSARGHVGDNDGRSSIRSLLAKGSTEISNTPVFGCALFDDSSSDTIKDARNVNQSK